MSFRNHLTVILLCAALLGSLAFPVWAAPNNALLDVRVGPHKQFDRVVFELQSEAAPKVTTKEGQKIEVRFSGLSVRDNFALPMLPPGLTILKRIDAFREGEDVIFEITLGQDATPTQLPLQGTPWRMAIDLAPRSAQVTEPKPEYIPGDLPIPTKLAGEDLTESSTATTTTPPAESSEDPAQAHAVLAYYYMDRGDTANANAQAYAYQKLTGKPLDFSARPASTAESATAKAATKESKSFWPKKLPKLILPTPVIWLFIFGGGLLGGLMLGKVLGGFRPPKLSLPKFKKKVRTKPDKVVAEEIESDLQALDDAVAQEPPRKAAPAPPPEPEPVPEPVMEEEREVKESLMDRRVRRVLELSREGRSVTAIAEELQMGQDEVKLILDLNQ